MRQIHIIVNCANKKKGGTPLILLRNIRNASVEKRAELWWADLCRASDFSGTWEEARNLYIGNYWSIVKQLGDLPDEQQIETKLWVISAGYGLISADNLILPYSATFTSGDVDSVTRNATELFTSRAAWWSKVATLSLPESAKPKSANSGSVNYPNPRSLAELFRRYDTAHFLVVASSDYLTAIQSDLVSGLDHLEDRSRLVIISSKTRAIEEGLKPHIVFTDARLVCVPDCPTDCKVHLLGRGLRGSIGVALARKYLKDILYRGFSSAQINTEIENALTISPKLFTHQRTPMSDSKVRTFIDRECRINISPSATRLLRKLRDNGYACEQKRFKRLYDQAIEEKQSESKKISDNA